jgi:hypothetical protein
MTEYVWPTHEQWEDSLSKHALHMIEHGEGYSDDWDPRFTTEERAEVDALVPEVVKVIRRACGRIERQLRNEHPDVAAILRAKGKSLAEIRQLSAAVDGLTGAARDAFDDLGHLGSVRSELSRLKYIEPDHAAYVLYHWPSRFERPTCKELDRWRHLSEQAVQRHKDGNRAMGHRLLVNLESGAAWEEQLKHRARCAEYFRRGPVVNIS